MSNPKNKAGKTDSRREFLKATTFAAAGIVVTPLIVSCGGDEAAPKKKPAGGKAPAGGGGKAPAPQPKRAPAAGAITLVDSADEVGDRGAVKLAAVTSKPVEKAFVSVAGKTDADTASKVNGGSGPYNDAFVALKGGVGGKNAVADVIFVLEPAAGSKALKHTGDAVGANWDFRFTRVMHLGQMRAVTYWIGDPVQHNINIKTGSRTLATQFNNSMQDGKPFEAKFAVASEFAALGLYEVACSMHDWEKGYLFVSRHAYVGVTGNDHDRYKLGNETREFIQGKLDGTVLLENVPVGTHTVKVFHDGREVKSFSVTVEKDKTAEPAPVEL